MNISILFAMLFCHIIDDWVLQGKLGEMKQKAWWRQHPQYKDMYKYDYIAALLTHAFSWTFMIMLPILIVDDFQMDILFIIMFIINFAIHAFVDDLKANKFKINLIQDQLVHIFQIIGTFIMFVLK
jgi:hypothetical protein